MANNQFTNIVFCLVCWYMVYFTLFGFSFFTITTPLVAVGILYIFVPTAPSTPTAASTPVSREACERCRKKVIYEEVMSIVGSYQHNNQEYFTLDHLIALGECFFHLSKFNDSSIDAGNLDKVSTFFESCSEPNRFQTNEFGECVPIIDTHVEISIGKFRKFFWELYKSKYNHCISTITEFQNMNKTEQREFVDNFYNEKNNFIQFMFGDLKCDIHH